MSHIQKLLKCQNQGTKSAMETLMYSSTKQEAVSLVLCNFENSGLPRGIISLISKSKYIQNTPEINTKVLLLQL